jgi:hypothetical protein
MLKPMREIGEPLAARIERGGVGELQQSRRERRFGADDSHHVIDDHLLVGECLAHPDGHLGKAGQIDLFSRQLDGQRFDQPRDIGGAACGPGVSALRRDGRFLIQTHARVIGTLPG